MGKQSLQILPTDDEHGRLLKAQLNQGIQEHWWETRPIDISGTEPPFTPVIECLTDMRVAAQRLWAGQPNELAPWLEEFVVAAKHWESYTRLRAEIGALAPDRLYYVTRHRLRAEADLWKVKNGAKGRAAPPAANQGDKGKVAGGEWLGEKTLPPSLFPSVVLPPPPDKGDPKWDEKRAEQFAKRCPRLNGKSGPSVEVGDGTFEKLLKARVHQGLLQLRWYWTGGRGAGPDEYSLRCDCLDDTALALVELLGPEPKELAPWLEELLVDAKEFERHTQLRVEAGALRPSRLNQVTRTRLKIEAELWKVKNAK
ncbi:hypothetical protein R5W23_001899 [Gemmata sp. JC673]|uniref:Uncharacterized protein n=1 Tax=Gemmata algarum TaxID=2975278 RepID=A0ABU5F3E2_9BACT|nr:hypothetical protein [Gemmata algarum]MDY3560653.1 hypothetical protein [Gemmata algarum]